MNSKQLEEKLKELDPRFSVVPNQNRPGLSNIFFEGRNYDLPAVPSDDIREEPDNSYRYSFPNMMSARFNSLQDVMPRAEQFLKQFNEGALDGLYG